MWGNVRLLVISTPDDHHAILAVFVLRNAGHEVIFWCPADLPVVEQASIHLECGSGGSGRIAIGGQCLVPQDAVLFRKYALARLPERMHPADRVVAQREFRHFVDGCFALVSPGAFWVNPWLSLFTTGKVAQLKAATETGMPVPATLISCDPGAIREFAGAAGSEGVILKSFAPAVWTNDAGESAVAITGMVTQEVLRDDAALSYAPAIYQQRIAKAYELRVTMFGTFGVAVRLESQGSELTALDWRVGGSDLPIRPEPLDERLRCWCAAFMQKLGISFGCFDFIVTPTGETIFLEVNPAGQFLWIEELNPDVKLLAPFCAFMAHGSFDFQPQGRLAYPDLADVAETAELEEFSSRFRQRHAAPVASVVVHE